MSQRRIHQINHQRLKNHQPVIVVHDYHCRHVGEFEKHAPCNCPSKRVPLFECAVHNLCTIQRRAKDSTIRWCETCPDFEPRTEETSADEF